MANRVEIVEVSGLLEEANGPPRRKRAKRQLKPSDREEHLKQMMMNPTNPVNRANQQSKRQGRGKRGNRARAEKQSTVSPTSIYQPSAIPTTHVHDKEHGVVDVDCDRNAPPETPSPANFRIPWIHRDSDITTENEFMDVEGCVVEWENDEEEADDCLFADEFVPL